jgi:hypothetical protein
MRTLAGWIVGVFGLGLLVGSFYASTKAEEEQGSLDRALASAPLVDCGSGREAVLEPILVDGKTTVRFKCVATAREPAVTHRADAPVAVSRPAAANVPAAAATPVAEGRASRAPQTADNVEKSSRSVKDSALIIGGSAGAGAGIGAIAKGKKGAALGAAIGGVAGAVYDLATRNKKH